MHLEEQPFPKMGLEKVDIPELPIKMADGAMRFAWRWVPRGPMFVRRVMWML